MSWHDGWRPYVSVAQRRRQAAKEMNRLRKKGIDIQPVEIEGRKIARTFWGTAWCDHLESFSDFANRLPRGRTYVRNGSVCHLSITKGSIEAIVSGSELYKVEVRIKTLPRKKWTGVKQRCSGRIGSLLELLQGRLSDSVMSAVTDRANGLFPLPGEIKFGCNCPDWAGMCKHIAAVLYGIGARLDGRPELLFQLRGVDHEELIAADAVAAVDSTVKTGSGPRLDDGELSDIFGIDLVSEDAAPRNAAPAKRSKKASGKKKAAKKPAAKKVSKKKAGRKKTARTARNREKAPLARKKTAKKATKKTVAKKTAKKKARKKQTARSSKPPPRVAARRVT